MDLPDRINRLEELAGNLWWSWTPEIRDLFRNIDHKLWLRTEHNAVRMLNSLGKEKLEELSNDVSFLATYDKIMNMYDNRVNIASTYVDELELEHPIVYFSLEFGLHQSLPIYSGGLGVLAGDTLKEASDMNLPYMAIGFFYQQGYFKQVMPAHGRQEAIFPKIYSDDLPLHPLMEDGKRVKLKIQVNGDTIYYQVWCIYLGRNKLYLLDTDIDGNEPWHRSLTGRLYGGDSEMRLNQEIVIAYAGLRLLEYLEIEPVLYHLNEGHCAFTSVKRMLNYVEAGKSYEDALEAVKKTTIFTTHTPVPAGHDRFGFDQIENKFGAKWDKLGIGKKGFFNLGMEHEKSNSFNMTALAMKTTYFVNGVSKLHTEVTYEMWKELLDSLPGTKLVDVTNGVHVPTWISGPIRRIFKKYISSEWMNIHDEPSLWDKIDDIPSKELWLARKEAKTSLYYYLREYARQHRTEGSRDAEQILAAGTLLDPDALTIGFARRFATYKRAALLFRDIERLRKILNDIDRPVQFIFAGKAHPADEYGKHVLQKIYEQTLDPENSGRIAFLEDYDMYIGRLLVQGVDVWMNTPKRPHEASGTSGMKAAMNGAPHFSISDGWWAEGFNNKNGWVIGIDETIEDEEKRDDIDSNSIYEILENEIVPKFYERNSEGVPEEWIEVVKQSIKTSIPNFTTRRMLKDYLNKMYLPAIEKMKK